MSTTLKTAAAVVLAAVLSAALFLSPVGIGAAQDATEEAPATEADPDRGPLTDEEHEARMAEHMAEHEAERQEVLEAFAAELGVTAEEVTAAARAVLEDRLAQRVSDGELTQAQADEILARADEHGFGLGMGLLGHGRGMGGPGFGHGPGRMGR